jgi:hypothetical protein
LRSPHKKFVALPEIALVAREFQRSRSLLSTLLVLSRLGRQRLAIEDEDRIKSERVAQAIRSFNDTPDVI